MNRQQEIEAAAQRRPIYLDAIRALKAAFRKLELLVPPPREMRSGDRTAFRYVEQTIEQAILLKLARLLSLLVALDLMTENALVQEQGILQRAIDETNEDIFFLSLAVTENLRTDLHEEYLGCFWPEEWQDPSDPITTRIPRGQVRRNKIRAFLNRAFGQPDPSSADAVSSLIFGMYSGFVHGAAPVLMELFDETTGKFMLTGIARSVRHVDYILDAQNSFYRGLMSGAVASKAFGDAETLASLQVAIEQFSGAIGIDQLEQRP